MKRRLSSAGRTRSIEIWNDPEPMRRNLHQRDLSLFCCDYRQRRRCVFWGLNQELWYDEIVTLTDFVRRPAHELFVSFGSLNNHLAFTWLAKASTAAFGEAPWSLRLPAAILGLFSIWAVWRLIRFTDLKWISAGYSGAACCFLSPCMVQPECARLYRLIAVHITVSAVHGPGGLKHRHVRDWIVLRNICRRSARDTSHRSLSFNSPGIDGAGGRLPGNIYSQTRNRLELAQGPADWVLAAQSYWR